MLLELVIPRDADQKAPAQAATWKQGVGVALGERM
jgi:hypothetical protein